MKSIILLLVAAFSTAASAETFKASAYNLGLAQGFVAYAEERLKPLQQELKNGDADLYCLSEVWAKKDRDFLVTSLKKDFPFAHFEEIEQTFSRNRPSCKITDLFGKGKFASCVLKECKDLDDSEFTQCVTKSCGPALRALQGDKRQCAQALMAQVGNSTVRSLIRVLNPLKRAGLFAYGGGNGLLLLSKKPMTEKGLVDLTAISTLNRRGALKAVVAEKQVYCAHLSANLDETAPYTGVFENWEEENFQQTKRLLDEAEKSTKPTLMMGDFNCSFDLPSEGIQGDFEKSCLLFRERGFDQFYLDQSPQCTFCSSNSLIAENPNEGGDFLIDHIFTRGVSDSVIKRVFDQKRTIKLNNGQPKETHLSDHYGLMIEIE